MKGLWFALALAVTSNAAYASDFCDAFAQFAKSITDAQPHKVTLTTNWTFPEPTRSCTPLNERSERQLCQWLADHTSTEFMTVNIVQALKCVGFAQTRRHGYFQSLTGHASIENFVSKDVSLEIGFDSAPHTGLPWLSVTVTRFDKK